MQLWQENKAENARLAGELTGLRAELVKAEIRLHKWEERADREEQQYTEYRRDDMEIQHKMEKLRTELSVSLHFIPISVLCVPVYFIY